MELLITIAGLLFCAFSLALIFLGKKVDHGGGKQRIVVGNYVNLQLSSMITLVVVTACLAATPLVLKYLTAGSGGGDQKIGYVSPDSLEKYYVKIQDLKIRGSAYEGNNPAEQATVYLIKNLNNTRDTIQTVRTLQQGDYEIPCKKVINNRDMDYEVAIHYKNYQSIGNLIDLKTIYFPQTTFRKENAQ
jgi:hypothetical protein